MSILSDIDRMRLESRILYLNISLIILAGIFHIFPAQGQSYPADIDIAVLPPHTSRVSEHIYQTDKFMATFVNTSFDVQTVNALGQITDGESALKLPSGPYTISGPLDICQGESAPFIVSGASPITGIQKNWLISTDQSCVNPAVLPDFKVEILSTGGFHVTNNTGFNSTYSNYTTLANQNFGWMILTGGTSGTYTGTTFNTPTFLPAGRYCIGWAEKDPSWEFANPPMPLIVYAPTVAGTLTYSSIGQCAPLPVKITINNYLADTWTWEYHDAPFSGLNWIQVTSPPVINNPIPGAQGDYYDVINARRYYRVTLKNGTCPEVSVAINVDALAIPDGSICVEPNIQPSPGPGIPGLEACIVPYPLCPTNWLPVCSGCDAILTLKNLTSGQYNRWNTKVTWFYKEAAFNCALLPPSPFSPGPPPPSSVVGSWTPVTPAGQVDNLRINTNPLTTTTWYYAHVEHANDPTCFRDFYALVMVFAPPKKPLITPQGTVITCQFPVTLSLLNSLDYPSPDCSTMEYSWDQGAAWSPIPVPDKQVTYYGKYVLSIRNECGLAVSDTVYVVPEMIPVNISGPCCVCDGGCATFNANPDIPGNTYQWTCIPSVPMSPNSTSSYIIICPATATTITLVVTNPNLCTKTLTKEIIICP